jgi:DNA-directed RNA polymerase specialized sigma24 family protein
MKMQTDERNLLRQYAERHSQEAFATLVSRHVNLVYSVALRLVRSPQLAEEVSQSVFTDLARNAECRWDPTVCPFPRGVFRRLTYYLMKP